MALLSSVKQTDPIMVYRHPASPKSTRDSRQALDELLMNPNLAENDRVLLRKQMQE